MMQLLKENKHHVALLIAFVGLMILLLSCLVVIPIRNRSLVDTGETRQAVEGALSRYLSSSAMSIDDVVLQDGINHLIAEPLIASLWLVDPHGVIRFHHKGLGKLDQNVSDINQADTAGVIGALPPGEFSEEQILIVQSVLAMRSEGEHNDVFRHLVKKINSPDGDLIGLLVLAYDVNPSVGKPEFTFQYWLLFGIVGAGVYWFSIPIWVWIDARKRGQPAFFWCMFLLFTNLLGLLAYWIVMNQADH